LFKTEKHVVMTSGHQTIRKSWVTPGFFFVSFAVFLLFNVAIVTSYGDKIRHNDF